MVKEIFKSALNIYMLNLPNYFIITLMMIISYIFLFKVTFIGGEFIRPFFLYGIFNVIFNFNSKVEIQTLLSPFADKDIAFKLLIYSFFNITVTTVGFILLLLPGVYFQIATIFVLPILVLEKDTTIYLAFIKSIKIFNSNLKLLLIILFLLALLNIFTAFPYGILSIFTIPYSICVIAATYQKISDFKKVEIIY